MSDQNKNIVKIIYDAIDEINLELVNKKISKSLDSELYGAKDLLDSFELVNFIVLVEEKIQKQLAKTIALSDDKALSQDYSPFGTVTSLVDYIENTLDEKSVD